MIYKIYDGIHIPQTKDFGRLASTLNCNPDTQVRMGSSLAMWSEYFPYGTIVGEAELRVSQALFC